MIESQAVLDARISDEHHCSSTVMAAVDSESQLGGLMVAIGIPAPVMLDILRLG